MEDSRLVRYIGQLDAKERERFKQFVLSPYFNQHKPTISLMQLILKQLDRSKPNLRKEYVYDKLFPNTAYDEQQLYNVMSYLMKLLHRFLAHQQLENTPFQEDVLTLEWTYDRHQFDLFKNRGKALQKQLDQYHYRDRHFLQTTYRLHEQQAYYRSYFEDRSNVDIFQRMLDQLDRFFLLEKFRHACHLTANMIMLNTRYDFTFLDDLLAYYEQERGRFADTPSIDLYYTILMSLRENDNPKHYNRLKYLLSEKTEAFKPKEQNDLYIFATNYCILQSNQGNSEYQRELFLLYQEGLRTGIVFENSYISEWDYKNMTALACALGEFEWVAWFLDTYRDHISAKRRENAYNYNKAVLHYHKKQYQEALSHLLLVQFSDVKYHLSHHSLLMRTYYSLGDTETLLSLIEAFRIYIIRNALMTTEQKRSYTNLLRFAKKLTLLKHQRATHSRRGLADKFAALLEQIQQTPNVANSHWLEEACREGTSVLVEG